MTAATETAKHTPGPWHVEAHDYEPRYGIIGKQGPITVCPAVAYGLPDARLIAAAPDMLAALKWAESALAPFSKEPAEKSGMALIRAAIRKATQPAA